MILFRFANSTVVWSWILNIFRLASGLILLPLVFHQFSTADLGLYYVLLSLAALAPIIDFGFGPTIDRFISYAMGGAEKLEAHGVPQPGASQKPNYTLLWQLLVTTRKLYRYLTLALLVLLGIGGTLMVEHLIHVEVALHPDFSPLIPRLAWLATLTATLLDIYSNWWGIFLRGMNEVRSATRIAVVAQTVKLALAAGLLLSGAGLLSLPIAGLVCSMIQRHYARMRCLKLLPPAPPMMEVHLRENFQVLWPNSWRLGVQLLSGSLILQANTFICANVFHLDASAKYGPSVQLMGIAASMSYVWTMIKWPLISQYRARHEEVLIQRVLWPRWWLQTLTFLVLASAVIFVAPGFLHWIGKDKEMLPLSWMAVLSASVFLDSQFTVWGTLIATGNRFPYLWPTVATNVGSLILTLMLVRFTTLGLGALVLGPLVAGCVFNYWYWPFAGARSIGVSLFRFLLFGPNKPSPVIQSAPLVPQ